ncbi:hypothetical protein [Pantoea sp. KPR_PJ]|uniref:hypothetical protein n=1 Tax=Pantoea sp. KPR_PJ TaxID=2738375 RepID=UPI0035296272
MKTASLEEIYCSASKNTVAMWAKNAGMGKLREACRYPADKLALATGIQPPMTQPVLHLTAELHRLTQDDPLADVQPASGLHVTFLPLTQPLYHSEDELPANVDQLVHIWRAFQAKTLVIRHLRLVALPSQLLLAGIPEPSAIAMRHAFCEKVLASPWREALLERHSNSPLPAPFWHSTLLRYGADFLPAYLRQFFFDRQDVDFGDVAGDLTFAKVNYNWTTCYPFTTW